MKFIKFFPSKNHRFIELGGHADLHGVFGFCERLSYQGSIACFFDKHLRHSAKYSLSLPFFGDFGALRITKGLQKKRQDEKT